MIFRTIGLGAACLALVAESIMIPPSVTLPGLTIESLNRHGDAKDTHDNDDSVQALPIPDDFLDKMKDLNLGVSKPLPGAPATTGDTVVIDVDMDDWEDFDWSLFDFEELPEAESVHIDGQDEALKWVKVDFGDYDFQGSQDDCPNGSSFDALFCRIRSTIKHKVEQVKPYFSHHRRPCPKKLAALAKQKAEQGLSHPPISGGIAKFWPYFHPLEDMPNSHHQHGHHHGDHHSKFLNVVHKICSGLRVFVTGFLIPVLIGVAAGMTASVLGMCVGTLLAWAWIKFVRGGKSVTMGGGRVKLDEPEVATGEKDDLLKSETVDEEAPPTYVERA